MIGAVIITFNPNIGILKKNLHSIIQQVESVLVVDNGSNNFSEFADILNNYKIDIIHFEENLGIACALNAGMDYFRKKKFHWVLTLDQDSILPKQYVEKLSRLDEFHNNDTGILGASYQDISRRENISNVGVGVVDNPLLITSGGLTNVEAWQTVGGFDEQLFIDVVDHDFNQRLIENRYKVLQAKHIIFNHNLGSPVNRPLLQTVLLIKKDFSPADHSKFRQYYIYRNSIIFIKRYSTKPIWHIIILLTTLRILLLFQNPMGKIRVALHGIRDGINYSIKKDDFFQQYLDNKKIQKDS
ncbi:glycosyltransferase [Leuconostoc litchii]|nr:glycosyltransferase [Leuconostoc litchii]